MYPRVGIFYNWLKFYYALSCCVVGWPTTRRWLLAVAVGQAGRRRGAPNAFTTTTTTRCYFCRKFLSHRLRARESMGGHQDFIFPPSAPPTPPEAFFLKVGFFCLFIKSKGYFCFSAQRPSNPTTPNNFLLLQNNHHLHAAADHRALPTQGAFVSHKGDRLTTKENRGGKQKLNPVFKKDLWDPKSF